MFTGGAVRYRIYSASGLDAIEVAKICFVAGLTFWLGNVAVLGLGFTYHPLAASASISCRLGQPLLGLGILAVLATMSLGLARRACSAGGLAGAAAGGPLTLLQM